jgi:hypothetical protein
MDHALSYAIRTGLLPQSIYPFSWVDGAPKAHCKRGVIATHQDQLAKVKGAFQIIFLFTETDLMYIFKRHLSVAIVLRMDSFLLAHYRHGVISQETAERDRALHVVQLIGWWNHPTAGPSWIFRNTWGTRGTDTSSVRLTEQCKSIS